MFFVNFLRAIKRMLDAVYTAIMPGFWLRMKVRWQWAGGIMFVAALWIASSLVFRPVVAIADKDDAKPVTTTPSVRVVEFAIADRAATITVRGRTQALHAVDVRAEIDGTVKAIHFDKGQKVRKGDVLCEIDLNDRGAKVDQMNAMVAQTAKELEVAQELYKEGFRSKTQLAQAQAAYEAAKAGASTMGVQLANTRIRAPWDGYVDDRYVDVGDYMRAGDKCEMVIAPEPFLAVGTVNEQEVGQVAIGDPATAKLVTGETVAGKVSFVADRADQTTRTFRVEVTLPNPDNKLRDGVSADIAIPVKKVAAMKVSPGILVLDDHGEVGVRVVEAGIVRFLPIKIISDAPDGMWIAGVPDRTPVITVGQEFVTDGERVQTVLDRHGSSS